MKEVNSYTSIYRKSLDYLMYNAFGKPDEIYFYSKILADVRANKVSDKLLKVLHQHTYSYFSISEAYCLSRILEKISKGHMFIRKIKVNKRAPENTSLNNEEEVAVIKNYFDRSKFEVEFSGKTQGVDGYLRVKEPLELFNIDKERLILHDIVLPVEIGYQKIEKTLAQLNETGLVRWPYDEDSIWILYSK